MTSPINATPVQSTYKGNRIDIVNHVEITEELSLVFNEMGAAIKEGVGSCWFSSSDQSSGWAQQNLEGDDFLLGAKLKSEERQGYPKTTSTSDRLSEPEILKAVPPTIDLKLKEYIPYMKYFTAPKFSDELDGEPFKHQMLGSLSPLAKVASEFGKTFKPYKTWSKVFKDVFLIVRGLGHVGKGLVTLALALTVYPLVRLFSLLVTARSLESVKEAWNEGLMFSHIVSGLSLFTAGLLECLIWGSMIVRIPYRAVRTFVIKKRQGCWPKIEDNNSIRYFVTQAKALLAPGEGPLEGSKKEALLACLLELHYKFQEKAGEHTPSFYAQATSVERSAEESAFQALSIPSFSQLSDKAEIIKDLEGLPIKGLQTFIILERLAKVWTLSAEQIETYLALFKQTGTSEPQKAPGASGSEDEDVAVV